MEKETFTTIACESGAIIAFCNVEASAEFNRELRLRGLLHLLLFFFSHTVMTLLSISVKNDISMTWLLRIFLIVGALNGKLYVT